MFKVHSIGMDVTEYLVYNAKTDEIVACFDTNEEAQKEADRLNESVG